MLDMIGQEVQPGDYFLTPGGNARYGGLILEVGIVLSMTDKRLKVAISKFDKATLRRTTKTSTKILLVTNQTQAFTSNDSVIALQKLYETQ